MKVKLLLLNPPFPWPVLRDYYCGTTSKGGYYWPPIDLIAQSGHLAPLGEVALVEATARGLSPRAALAQVVATRPDVVLSLVATPSLAQDMAFLQLVKRATGAVVVVAGEPVMEWTEGEFARWPQVNAVLGDFTSPDLALWLSGQPHGPALVRREEGQGAAPNVRRTGAVDWPTPRHDLFLSQPYRHPFLGRGRLGTLLMAYGCPFRCAYCNSGFESLGFARRTAAEVLAESEQLRSLGARRLYVKDMTFAADAHLAREVLEGWQRLGITWPWAAWARLDHLNLDLLPLMQASGCRGIQVGLEAVDIGEMHQQQRRQNTDELTRRVRAVAAAGLKVGGHFVLGLPGQSRQSMAATLRWALSLPLAYASFNVYTPRHHTGAYTDAVNLKLKEKATPRDASRGGTGLDPDLTGWQRHANRRFFGRPRQAVTAAGLWLRQAGVWG